MDKKKLIIVYEYRHLEVRRFGLFLGLSKVVEALPSIGKLLIICRNDKIDNVLRLFTSREKRLLVMDSVSRDFWESRGDSFI